MSEQHDPHRGVEWTAKRRRRAVAALVAVVALVGLAAPRVVKSVSWSGPGHDSVSWTAPAPKEPKSVSWSSVSWSAPDRDSVSWS